MTQSLVVTNAMCHLQHVEAEGLVLRAEHTQLRHALHRPGNTASIYIRTYTHPRRMYTHTHTHVRARERAYSMNGARARARVYAPSPGPIRPLVKASMRARDMCTTCPRNKLSIAVVSEISRTIDIEIFERDETFFISLYHFPL